MKLMTLKCLLNALPPDVVLHILNDRTGNFLCSSAVTHLLNSTDKRMKKIRKMRVLEIRPVYVEAGITYIKVTVTKKENP